MVCWKCFPKIGHIGRPSLAPIQLDANRVNVRPQTCAAPRVVANGQTHASDHARGGRMASIELAAIGWPVPRGRGQLVAGFFYKRLWGCTVVESRETHNAGGLVGVLKM